MVYPPAMRTLSLAAFAPPILTLGLLAACTAPDVPAGETANVPGDAADGQPFNAIGDGEVIRFAGTEPFWGGDITGNALRWTTLDNTAGETITVTRFAGRGGLSFTGTLQGAPFDLAVTPATCSDGMSDRTYPYAVTVAWADQQLSGCGWTDRQGYTGGE
jgi:uncharacterized membrane protein